MIWQNDARFRPQIREYGCYYMDLIWWGAYKAGFPVDVEMINEELYWRWLKKGWITETCFVMDPVAILQDMGVEVRTVSKISGDYKPKADELTVAYWETDDGTGHFVAMIGECVAYDSWQNEEGGSKTVREGKLLSYRVFRR